MQLCGRTSTAQPAAPATCPARLCSQGASKNVTYQEWDKIWSINKRLIDPVCPRHTAVETDCKCATVCWRCWVCVCACVSGGRKSWGSLLLSATSVTVCIRL